MMDIAFPGLAFRTPVIAFGCSSLTGTDPGNANRVLETAFDAGVRHFDTARYYGYGEAGRILGRFLKRPRDLAKLNTALLVNIRNYFSRKLGLKETDSSEIGPAIDTPDIIMTVFYKM
jgi:aryl-alcohol dehydrogenase-like predicted oxidoreductase